MCVLITHMKHIITISNDTLLAINNAKATNLVLTEQDKKIRLLEIELLLPSGRARKGGRKEVSEANVVRDHLYNEWQKTFNLASNLLRTATKDYIKASCIRILENQSDQNDSDVGTILRAAVIAIQHESGKHTIRIDNSLAGYGFEYDVFCAYSEHSGLTINVTEHNQGRSISGGIANVRRKYQPFLLEDERVKDVKFSINEQGDLAVDVPASYADGGYVVTLNNHDELTSEEAHAMARVITALGHICHSFTNIKLACFEYATSSIL